VPGCVALAPGTPIGDGLTLFHDGARPGLALRLARNTLDGDRPVQLDTTIETESPLRIFARLNIRHGHNSARILREIPADAPQSTVEFDRGYAGLNAKRIAQGWLDLIFETPRMNRVALHDVTLCRRRRAAL
jgi:hypothetical protein